MRKNSKIIHAIFNVNKNFFLLFRGKLKASQNLCEGTSGLGFMFSYDVI